MSLFLLYGPGWPQTGLHPPASSLGVRSAQQSLGLGI